jgi:hypothetical protein
VITHVDMLSVCRLKRTDMLGQILDLEHIDPSFDDNECMRVAVLNSDTRTIDLLIGHPKSDASREKEIAMRMATYYGFQTVIDHMSRIEE